MPSQNLVTNNLGQYGYMPDVAVTSLPPNSATYTRNFRFNEGDYAEVSPGYTNALTSRNFSELGDMTTNATFLYTWILDSDNAFFYYDAGNSEMRFVENNSSQNLVDFNLSVMPNPYVDTLNHSETPTTTAGTFRITATALTITPSANATAAQLTAALTTGAMIEFYQNNVLLSSVAYSGTMTDSSGTITITQGGFPQFFTNEQGIAIRVATTREHNITDLYSWSATDVLGVPVFNNPDENPYIFTDTTVPSIQPLTRWPGGATCNFLTRFNAFMVAVGYRNPTAPAGFRGGRRTIAISDVITTPGVAPFWGVGQVEGTNYTDAAGTQQTVPASSFSQIIDLSLYTDGDLVSAFESNNALYVNTTTDVIVFTYQGNGEFAGTRLPTGSGVITQNGSVPINNGFFNIGNGRIYTHDGSSFTPVGEGIWTDSWFDSVDNTRLSEVQCVYDPRTKSVWIKTPVGETSQEIWIYNLVTQSLSVLDDHQEINYMLLSTDGIPATNQTRDTFMQMQEWDMLQQDSWNDFSVLQLGEFRNRILSVGGRNLFVHDFGTTYNGRPINAIFQKEFIQPSQTTYDSFTINRVVLWLDGPNGTQAEVRVGGSSSPARNTTTFTPYRDWTLGTTQKRDFRFKEKWGAITIACEASGTRLTGYEMMIGGVNRR